MIFCVCGQRPIFFDKVENMLLLQSLLKTALILRLASLLERSRQTNTLQQQTNFVLKKKIALNKGFEGKSY